MKRLVQVKYTQFSEIFEANVDNNDNLNIELKEVLTSPRETSEYLNLDLSTDFRSSYSDFPFEKGDLSVIQAGNIFIVTLHAGENIHWMKFDTSQILSYIFKNPVLDEILPFLGEDEHLFLNSLLSDFIRNDYSFNEINKKIKFAKIACLMAFINDYLKFDYERVLLDETLLGDIEIDNILMAFRFSGKQILSLVKIDNLSKVLIALEKNKVLDTKFQFEEKIFFVNNFDNSDKLKLILNENGLKYDYEVLPQKNYIFNLGEKEYKMEFGRVSSVNVSGKICVFNGDIRDLMIG